MVNLYKENSKVKDLKDKIIQLEEDFEDLYQNAPCGYLSFLPDGTIIKANKTASEWIGYERDELAGNRKLQEILPPGGKIFIQTHIIPILKLQGKVKEINLDIFTKSGQRRPFLINFNSTKTENGDIELIRASLFEMSDRKKYESELLRAREEARQKEQQLRIVMNVVPAMIGYVDTQERYRMSNTAYYEFFGLHENNINGRTMREILGDENYKAVQPHIWQALKGHHVDFEQTMKDKDNEQRIIKVSYRPDMHEGSVKGFVIHFQDITQQKRFGQELEKRVDERTYELKTTNEELTRSNSDLEQFAYVASHDLKEPLRMVASYTQLFTRKYETTIDEDGKLFINYIRQGVDRMASLINDLLEYSRIGKTGTERVEIAVSRVVDEVMGRLHTVIEEKDAKIIYSKLPIIRFPELHLEMLLTNLIGNALKFTQTNARPEVEISAQRREGEWLFSIRDNGIGMQADYYERIFVIFQRLHGRDEFSGTGIGLAICKRIIEQYGGRIWVESVHRKGSTFYFTIKDES